MSHSTQATVSVGLAILLLLVFMQPFTSGAFTLASDFIQEHLQICRDGRAGHSPEIALNVRMLSHQLRVHCSSNECMFSFSAEESI